VILRDCEVSGYSGWQDNRTERNDHGPRWPGVGL